MSADMAIRLRADERDEDKAMDGIKPSFRVWIGKINAMVSDFANRRNHADPAASKPPLTRPSAFLAGPD